MNTKRRIRVCFVLLLVLVGTVAYTGWRAMIRPWNVAQELAGATEEAVIARLGEPDLMFHSNSDLNESRLVPLSYVFTPFPGPGGQSPPGIRWAGYSTQTPAIAPRDLPAIEEQAYWYDLPLTAGVLVYLKDSKVEVMYHGGT